MQSYRVSLNTQKRQCCVPGAGCRSIELDSSVGKGSSSASPTIPFICSIRHHDYCYTLSCPETHWVLGGCTMGYGTSASSAISSIPFCSSSCLLCLLIYPWILFPPMFHVSELCFVSHFRSTLHFCSPCSIFRSPNPDPDICPIPSTLICPLSIYIRSKPHVCSSVWNQHWLSLKLIVQNSEPTSRIWGQ